MTVSAIPSQTMIPIRNPIIVRCHGGPSQSTGRRKPLSWSHSFLISIVATSLLLGKHTCQSLNGTCPRSSGLVLVLLVTGTQRRRIRNGTNLCCVGTISFLLLLSLNFRMERRKDHRPSSNETNQSSRTYRHCGGSGSDGGRSNSPTHSSPNASSDTTANATAHRGGGTSGGRTHTVHSRTRRNKCSRFGRGSRSHSYTKTDATTHCSSNECTHAQTDVCPDNGSIGSTFFNADT